MERRRKRELRELNLKVWAGEKDVFPTTSAPDSSLKKNTALIKRIRTGVTGSSAASYLQEIRSLSLHKYLSELISACYEGLCKLKAPADMAIGVEIMSALHQRFGPSDFTMHLGWYIGRGLATPDKSQLKALSPEMREKEEKERLHRQRNLLRAVTELWLVGVLKSLEDTSAPEEIATKGKDAPLPSGKTGEKSRAKVEALGKSSTSEPFPLEALKDILMHDRDHAALATIVMFVKAYSWDLLGVRDAPERTQEEQNPTDTVEDTEEQGSREELDGAPDSTLDLPLIGTETQEMFKTVLEQYLVGVKAHVVKDQKAVLNQGRKNAEAYVKSGEVFEDRQSNYEKQLKAQEKLIANTQSLCEVLGSDMPDLRGDELEDAATTGAIGLVKTAEYLRGQGEGAGIWEDEEERRFYENIIDLKDRVPGILLEDAKKKKPDGDAPVGKKQDGEGEVEEDKEKPAETDDQSVAIANKTVGAQVDALLARLPELQTRDGADQVALDFCFLNSKASRNRLIKQMQDIPKGRTDLYPLYARLIATLAKYMPDVSSGIVNHLDDEFRSLQRRKTKDFLSQARSGNVKYLSELTKFGIVPEHVIFHCLKIALDDFSRMNIEIIAGLLEGCGRYLLRNPETSPRMTSFMETLKRKKTVHHLSQQDRMLLENALYYVDPPERSAIEQKERTPTDAYIRKLIYLDLNQRTFKKILRSIRKLHWEEPDVVQILQKIFSKPHRLKYSSIQFLAGLLQHLYKYHPEFVIRNVDALLEQILLGLEQNDFRYNQRRIAEVKYLAELYVYQIVNSEVIFETLYQLIRFGHFENFPTPDRQNPLDPPDDFFRLHLVCTVLDTCGSWFERGPAKKKLDCFLAFLEYYIFTKDPAPQDIKFKIEQTFNTWRPKWEFSTDLESAFRKFNELLVQNCKVEEAEAVEAEVVDDDLSSVEGDGDLLNGNEEDGSQSSDAEMNDEHKASSDSEPEIVVTRQEEERDPEAEAEFDRELAKMMADSVDSRKFDRKLQFDVPLPMRKGLKDVTVDNEQQESNPTFPPNMMAFSLMTKRGNKQQTRTIGLPSDSTFAIAMRSQQEAERAEQQRIKNLVLNYDLQDSGEADGTASNFLQPNMNLTFTVNPLQTHYRHVRRGGFHHSSTNTSTNINTKGHENDRTNAYQPPQGSLDKHHHNPSLQQTPHHQSGRSSDKTTITRNGQRARKLQLSDVDWYGKSASARDVRDGAIASKKGARPSTVLKELNDMNLPSKSDNGRN